MATVTFSYRSKKDTTFLEARLSYRITGNPNPISFYTRSKIEVSKDFWSDYAKNTKFKDVDKINLKKEIDDHTHDLKNYILDEFDKTDLSQINKDWFKNIVHLYYNPPQPEPEIKDTKPTNLIEYIDFYLDYRKHEIRPTSIKKYNVIKHKLERMQSDRKKLILIADIDESFKNEFVEYQKNNGYSQNTIQRELGIIKTFCKHARYLGLETSPQLDGLRLDKAKAEKIYLTFEELEAIENQIFENDYLDNARDWLIISCYTGQRVSDFLRFKKDMIRIENGKSLLEFTQKKTGKVMTVPLHRKVLQILEKRNGEFPRQISDQRYNEYIKEVCQLAGLDQPTQGGKQETTEHGIRKVSGKYPKWELVTSHIGRRSFATNFYGRIPTTYLIYITGHSSEAMFLNYIGKSNKDLAMEISNYF
ncbi:tyrosine-type recombinase/integrase [Moheibacter stercoris]|uniref:Integrase n=1 Tax=Moheibacter stercoris TaxID=1628251 RepID=A0ABV2LQ55_9FLAO